MNCYTKCYASFVSMFLLFVVMQSPSLGFDFSKNYAKTLPNPTTAGVGGITQAKLYKCDSEGCQTIKEKIKPINDKLAKYDEQINLIISDIDDPEVKDLVDKINNLEAKEKKDSDDKNKLTDMIDQLIILVAKHNPDIKALTNEAKPLIQEKDDLEGLNVSKDEKPKEGTLASEYGVWIEQYKKNGIKMGSDNDDDPDDEDY